MTEESSIQPQQPEQPNLGKICADHDKGLHQEPVKDCLLCGEHIFVFGQLLQVVNFISTCTSCNKQNIINDPTAIHYLMQDQAINYKCSNCNITTFARISKVQPTANNINLNKQHNLKLVKQ
jgi:hypothetical protein